jgi:hypothetical protein
MRLGLFGPHQEILCRLLRIPYGVRALFRIDATKLVSLDHFRRRLFLRLERAAVCAKLD